MSKWSKPFMALALMGLSHSAQAQTQLKITWQDDSQETLVYDLDDVQRLEFFSQGFKVRTKDNQTKNCTYSDVHQITFPIGTSGITAPVSGSNDALTLARRGETLVANLQPGTVADATVYDLGGRAVMSQKGWDGSPLSIAQLPQGVYVFKVNGEAIKFTK